MYRKEIFLIGLVSMMIFLFGCGQKGINDKLHFSNSFENYADWGFSSNTIIKGDAHSGRYVCQLDSSNQYSILFKSTLGDITDKPLKKIKCSVWAYFPEFTSRGSLVISGDSAVNKSLFWNGTRAQDFITEPKQWTKIETTVDFPESFSLKKENVINVYLWNDGKGIVCFDDLEFSFE